MTATVIFQVFAGLSGLLFAASMLAVGLSLTTAHARQPLVNPCRVADNP